ncbi:MAG: pyridoxal phosphate-dependent aminotransferase [Syntrophales bacterium]|jgi:aspartate aminotransferase|nr:pyridoxal phosphate-dependent aminotransferase [Syntrophales bacterium]MDD4338293.1 pyridoxal phosphate-dependent aminotransferase [Syntrophales bacterium]
MNFARRIQRIKPSPTLAITMKANALRSQGRDIIGFGAGEPDFDTPEHIRRAAVEAIEQGFTRYTPVGGIDELKDAVTAKLLRDQGLAYQRSQIVVSCGAKHTLYNLAQVLFEEGDDVIIPAPYWVSYPDIVLLAGANPVILPTREEDGYKVQPSDLVRAFTPATKAVILNSPSNPTGAAYSEAELRALGDVVRDRDIWVISDDIYEKIVYDGFRFHHMAALDERLRAHTLVVNGVSKAYAMTGWRIGYAAGPADVIAAVTKIQSQNTSNTTSISQKAAVAALNGDQGVVGAMVEEFQRRRDVIVAGLNAMEGVRCHTPQGAFYVFPNVARLFGKSYHGRTLTGSADVAAWLLDAANCAVVPGIAFGEDTCIRLSYATSLANIETGLERIAAAIKQLS